jgi:viroplasmin and RNaseH domain-containing protein
MNPCYVVFNGRKRGVFDNWPNCQEQVHKFHGASYKKYNSYEVAVAAFNSRRNNSNPPLAQDDDICLQNPTAAPLSFSFKTVVIAVLFIYVCHLWKKLSSCTDC